MPDAHRPDRPEPRRDHLPVILPDTVEVMVVRDLSNPQRWNDARRLAVITAPGPVQPMALTPTGDTGVHVLDWPQHRLPVEDYAWLPWNSATGLLTVAAVDRSLRQLNTATTALMDLVTALYEQALGAERQQSFHIGEVRTLNLPADTTSERLKRSLNYHGRHRQPPASNLAEVLGQTNPVLDPGSPDVPLVSVSELTGTPWTDEILGRALPVYGHPARGYVEMSLDGHSFYVNASGELRCVVHADETLPSSAFCYCEVDGTLARLYVAFDKLPVSGLLTMERVLAAR